MSRFAGMSRPPGLDVYKRNDAKPKILSVAYLEARLRRRQHRIIRAGFRNVPLTYWFMNRVKSYMIHMSVRSDARTSSVVEFCLDTKNRDVVNSYTVPVLQYDESGEPVYETVRTKRGKSVRRQVTRNNIHVGSSWLSQAVHTAYNFMVQQHGCRAPIHAFVMPLDPLNEVQEGRRSTPRKIQLLHEHLSHLELQEHFLYLLAQYQAAKEQREKDQYQNRTNPQRLLDLEKEKLHIQMFRSFAAEIGAIRWNPPYMTRGASRVSTKSTLGMVGSHGQPTAKEFERYKKRLRLGKGVSTPADPLRRKRENDLSLGAQDDSFTADREPPPPSKRRSRPKKKTRQQKPSASSSAPQSASSNSFQLPPSRRLQRIAEAGAKMSYLEARERQIDQNNRDLAAQGLDSLAARLRGDDPESTFTDSDEESLNRVDGDPSEEELMSADSVPVNVGGLNAQVSLGMIGAL